MNQDFDVAGEFQYEKARKAKEQALEGLSDTTRAYILEKSYKDLTPLEAERKRFMESIQGYWSVAENVISNPARTLPTGTRGPVSAEDLIRAYGRWRSHSPEEQRQALINTGLEEKYFKQLDSLVSKARRLFRENDRLLDASLYRFGKTTTLAHKDNIGKERMFNTNLGREVRDIIASDT